MADPFGRRSAVIVFAAAAALSACGGESTRRTARDAGGGSCSDCGGGNAGSAGTGNGASGATGGAGSGAGGGGPVRPTGGASGTGGSGGRGGGGGDTGDPGGEGGMAGDPGESCEPEAVRCLTVRERCSSAGSWEAEEFVCAAHLGASAEYQVACATKADGSTACWGTFWQGEALPGLLAGELWEEVHLADEPTFYPLCAIDRARSATCWDLRGGVRRDNGPFRSLATGQRGLCFLGPLGTFSCTSPSDLIVPVDPGPLAALEINNDRLYALGEDGRLYVPSYLDFPDERYLDLSGNGNGACALRMNGAVVCRPELQIPPAELEGERFVDIELEYSDALCGRRADGTVRCWDHDGGAQRFVAPEGRFTLLTSHSSALCGIRDDGSIACWGPGALPLPEGW